MNSPYTQNLSGTPQQINRVTITVTGPANSGKSAIGAAILQAFRAQGFQIGLTDAQPDNPPANSRLAMSTIMAVEVRTNDVVADLQAQVNDLTSKLIRANDNNRALQARLDAPLQVETATAGSGETYTPPPEVTGFQVSVEAPKKTEPEPKP